MRDLDFIVATKEPEASRSFFVEHPLVESIIAQGATKTSVRLRSGIQCDLRVVALAEYPFALNYFTGSKEHNIVMRNRALQRGWTLNEYRLAPLAADPARRTKKRSRRNRSRTVREEADLYRALGLDFIPPELRENCGEFEAAEEHRLPRLIEKENLRGTFHCHTTRERRTQYAGGNGRRPRRNSACNISASPITAAARFRRMASMKRGCARRWRRSGN